MTEAAKINTSCFLIALDPKEGEQYITSYTQEAPKITAPLLKSKSVTLNLKNQHLIPESEESDDGDHLLDSISVLEESHSWVTESDPRIESRDGYSKSRKTGKKYNRKEKSLGELCKKFIYLYGSKSYWIIALDECTYTLGVERRRIYDIINILESFNVLSRLAKNQYEWRGIAQIGDSIQRMRKTNEDDSASAPMKKRKKKKSLGILCESFIKQFLTWRTTISLEQAARRISDNYIDESKLKTKVRRLYDIANVLAALNLIEKTSLETRKPAFKWVGEEGLQYFVEEMELYFREQSNDHKSDRTISNVKTPDFEFKSGYLNATENPELSKPFQRLNSASTTTTFKNIAQIDEEELTFGNSIPTLAMLNPIASPQGGTTPRSSQPHLNAQLVELLEKLTVCQRSHPIYRPTPVYPINHFLSNSYSVSELCS